MGHFTRKCFSSFQVFCGFFYIQWHSKFIFCKKVRVRLRSATTIKLRCACALTSGRARCVRRKKTVATQPLVFLNFVDTAIIIYSKMQDWKTWSSIRKASYLLMFSICLLVFGSNEKKAFFFGLTLLYTLCLCYVEVFCSYQSQGSFHHFAWIYFCLNLGFSVFYPEVCNILLDPN